MKKLEYPTIESSIIGTLSHQSYTTVKLLGEVQKNLSCTRQGYYKILRKLKNEEVLIVRNKIVSLSYLWIQKQMDFYTAIFNQYTQSKKPSEDFLLLEDTDSIVYTFKNTEITDVFWNHALSILNQKVDRNIPLCIYNPHEWFLLVRKESEKAMFHNVESIGRKLVVLIDHTTPLDMLVKKEFNFKNNHYYATPKTIIKKSNYYLNVIGDYIIEVTIDKKTSRAIDEWYLKTKVYDEIAKKELSTIIQSRGKNKLQISKDKTRAETLRKTFRKFFVV
jgi:hypothetical protein